MIMEKSKEKKHYGVEFWNNKAKYFRKGTELGIYEKEFFRLANIPKGATIFDMGCGAGTLTLPLAAEGHEVYSADFSPVMLEHLEKEAKERGLLDRIHIYHMKWEDDWDKYNIPICDIAISSRSLIVDDIKEGILKLASKAKKQVYITSSTPVSTHINTKLALNIGFKDIPEGKFQNEMKVLLDLGIMPRLDFIHSDRRDKFISREECFEKMSERYFPRKLTNEELEKLKMYNEEHLQEKKDENGDIYFEYDEVWPVRWAFIAWDKDEQLPSDIRALWNHGSSYKNDCRI